MKRPVLIWLPALFGLLLCGLFYAGLRNPDDHIIPSTLVGKPLPEFDTPAALPGRGGVASADFTDGKPRLLNVFASWCVPCVQEVGVLARLRERGVDITGIAIHDSTTEVADFLARNGDPYGAIGLDNEGRTQVAFGSTGVPETFVIDGTGRILYQHIGVVTDADIPKLLDLMREGR
ncbi:MAG: redoxin family protein [Porphyrobacter sp.]|nr:redoxin family protein [Porphyrobacter sp.]